VIYLPRSARVNLAGLVFSCSGICSYVTTTNAQGSLYACSTNPSYPGCNALSFDITTQNGVVDGSRFLLSPDGVTGAGIGLYATASAGHGSLGARSSATDSAFLPSMASGSSDGRASFSEFWTIDTGLGGGFIDIVFNVNVFNLVGGGSCATLQNAFSCFSQTSSTGKQAFSDNSPFPVTGSVDASSPALSGPFSSVNEISLSITSLNIYDAQMNLLSKYSLTVTDAPEAGTWAKFVLAALMLRIISRKKFLKGRSPFPLW
jgi:hypothetical protein